MSCTFRWQNSGQKNVGIHPVNFSWSSTNWPNSESWLVYLGTRKYEGGPRIGGFCPVFLEFPALSKRSLLCGQKPPIHGPPSYLTFPVAKTLKILLASCSGTKTGSFSFFLAFGQHFSYSEFSVRSGVSELDVRKLKNPGFSQFPKIIVCGTATTMSAG